MLVSIIITAYNVEKYLRECLDSVVAQDYESREILVIDDGSVDGTAAICREYAERVPGLQYIYQENAGVSVARNRGMELAVGEALMFVDGDDCLAPGMLRKLVDLMEPDVDLVCCGYQAFRREWQEDHSFFEGNQCWCTVEDKEQLMLQLLQMRHGQPGQQVYTGIGVPWGKLYRRSALKASGLQFLPQLRRMQDNVFNMYAFAKLGRIVYLDESLYRYRLDHITGSRVPYAPEIYCTVLEQREAFFKENPLWVTEQTELLYHMEKMDYLLRCIKHIAFTCDTKRAVKKLRELCRSSLYREFLRRGARKEEPLKYRLVRFLARLQAYGIMVFYYQRKA